MTSNVKRVYVEKRDGFNVEAKKLYNDFKSNLNIKGLRNVRVLNRYDVSHISEENFKKAVTSVFSEPNQDIFKETISIEDKMFAVEFLPGQYDQRADSAAQCIQLLTQKEKPIVKYARIIVLVGEVNDADINKIKEYYINPVDSREASLKKQETLEEIYPDALDVEIIGGFINKTKKEIQTFMDSMGFAMSLEDLLFCQDYFKNTEKRNPTITELRVIDTYWSDHCRHTTFSTRIENVIFDSGSISDEIKNTYNQYIESREYVYENKQKDICLMDLATIGMKELRKKGMLNDLEVSDEINACSIIVNVDRDGKNEEWLVMFKNETHNHPTEIEPFGGAATCLGGAIRDPLSGRSYVYQAMRITGSGDPRQKIEDTLKGKLPQRKITTEAAHGYSSYGNQIGLATGKVVEIYDDDYIAKRMEIGAVIAAAPRENVKREAPLAGDVIILVGGRTGRDGCGGATGSSKEHTEESILTCGSEVQKGNPPTERKIQRLFRNSEVSQMIKKCNDFGAGGVSVAIGELADGLEINLDNVLKKYEGLDGTELAISESQERMAVVIREKDVEKFKDFASKENLESTIAAKVTDGRRLKMYWRGKTILDISRDFLDTNGVKQKTDVLVKEPVEKDNYFNKLPCNIKSKDMKESWLENLRDLNCAAQKGLVERFDSTIGAGTVVMPFGGKTQMTPSEGMAATIPLLKGETNTCTLMTHGFDPKLSKWSPYHGAVYAVVHSAAKITAMGGDYRNIRLTLQEYFEKLNKEPERWGKPFSALLGAFKVQNELKIPAIGGKDSMSGTFKDMNVPPTLVSFAVAVENIKNIITPEFKKADSKVVLIPIRRDKNKLPDFDDIKSKYEKIYELARNNKIMSAHTVGYGGIAAAISKMTFGNNIGFKSQANIGTETLYAPLYGDIIIEIENEEDIKCIDHILLGKTTNNKEIEINSIQIEIDEMLDIWLEPLNDTFPVKADVEGKVEDYKYTNGIKVKSSISIGKPRILIPVFPGTNCEYDTGKAFEKAGGIVDTFVFKNITAKDVEESVNEMARRINQSQIIALAGGFSAGDEPEGSGKFITAVFRNPILKEAVMNLINNRDGLMLGICNGFQALIKLGLLPFGEIKDLKDDYPTLTYNKIGRHVSTFASTKVVSNLSPWFSNCKVGDMYNIPLSHGEGRFTANKEYINKLKDSGQIAVQYVDPEGKPTLNGLYNPNGSVEAIEGITSPDGRILGKMGHSERIGNGLYKNIPGNKDQKLFKAGVDYFRL